jgi:putative peptidoglycan lipid II flippase
VVLCGLGAGGMVAVAGPAAGVLGTVSGLPRHTLAATIIAFAPGLFGYGLFALYSRALYARGENRAAARATLAGWGAVIVASVALGAAVPAGQRVPAVAAGNSVGMVVLGVVLVLLVRARAGTGAATGLGRALGVSVAAGSVAAVAGVVVRLPLADTPGFTGSLLQGMLSGVAALLGFLALAGWLAREQVAPLLRRLGPVGRLAGRFGQRRPGQPGGAVVAAPDPPTGQAGDQPAGDSTGGEQDRAGRTAGEREGG